MTRWSPAEENKIALTAQNPVEGWNILHVWDGRKEIIPQQFLLDQLEPFCAVSAFNSFLATCILTDFIENLLPVKTHFYMNYSAFHISIQNNFITNHNIYTLLFVKVRPGYVEYGAFQHVLWLAKLFIGILNLTFLERKEPDFVEELVSGPAALPFHLFLGPR